jgi:hypothetical protein
VVGAEGGVVGVVHGVEGGPAAGEGREGVGVAGVCLEGEEGQGRAARG